MTATSYARRTKHQAPTAPFGRDETPPAEQVPPRRTPPLSRFLDVVASMDRSRQTFEAVQALVCPVGHAVAGEPCWWVDDDRPALCGSRIWSFVEGRKNAF